MLDHDRIDISEGIDVDKTNKSKECMLCHYWYFLDKNFSYGSYLCNGCYNMKQKSVDLKILLLFILKKNACRLYFLCMSKHKAKKLTTNSNLIDKMGIL